MRMRKVTCPHGYGTINAQQRLQPERLHGKLRYILSEPERVGESELRVINLRQAVNRVTKRIDRLVGIADQDFFSMLLSGHNVEHRAVGILGLVKEHVPE